MTSVTYISVSGNEKGRVGQREEEGECIVYCERRLVGEARLGQWKV